MDNLIKIDFLKEPHPDERIERLTARRRELETQGETLMEETERIIAKARLMTAEKRPNGKSAAKSRTQLKKIKTAGDALGDIAIQVGTQQTSSNDLEEATLTFTDSEEKMLKQLSASLALSAKTIIESAISYAYFDTKKKGLKIDQLPEYLQALGSRTFKLALSAETIHKLDELEMAQNLSECAATRIRLLYKKLINYESSTSSTRKSK